MNYILLIITSILASGNNANKEARPSRNSLKLVFDGSSERNKVNIEYPWDKKDSTSQNSGRESTRNEENPSRGRETGN